MKLVAETLTSLIQLPRDAGTWPRLCMDLGYDYQVVRNRVWGAYMVPWITAWREDRQNKRRVGIPPRRWVVERTHSWLNRFRCLMIRWEKRADTYLVMLQFACGLTVWRFALSK